MLSNILQFEERQFSIAEVRLNFCLLSTLFLDVQTEFHWSYLSSQSKEFRGGFFIDSYTKAQLLPRSRIFFIFYFFLSLGLPSSLNHSRLVSLRLLLILTLPLNWTLVSGDHQHGVLLLYTGTETGLPAERMAMAVTHADPKHIHMHIQHTIA